MDDDISMLLKEGPRTILRAVSLTVHHHNTSVSNNVHQTGRAQRVCRIVPYILTDFQKNLQCELSRSLFTREPTRGWINKMSTGVEKRVLCDNHANKYQWVPTRQTAESDPKGKLQEKIKFF
ncbi:hypothetical protein B9Z55_010648 [Caenorhabditis nigoni]|uniref:Uncharacterized protein n=1 Tax=Caenorhabditis nigoni TaxID=1611254 RepID=A0A2G5UGX1_9PELO|nr:hypothetical protein B9Z55_010648 [Caenorhabditis nigoni]